MNSGNSLTFYDANFIVCDVETTGLSAFNNRIIEIALLKINGGEIIDKYQTLVNPQQHIPKFITNLTGITNEDVIKQPAFENIAGKIIEFFNDSNDDNLIFVGHNADFDYRFLRESFNRLRNSFNFNYRTLCTCKLSRRVFRRLKSKSLSNVASYLGIEQPKHHRAYYDTLTTAKILLALLEYVQDEYEIDTIEELLKFQNSRIYSPSSLSPALKRTGLNLKEIPESPGIYYMRSRSGEILYIGKAKNLKERISTYFRHNSEISYKIRKLLASVHSLDYEITNSELSALILESKKIKEHKPRFNTAIKRFRHHPFLKLDVQNDFPRIDKVYEIENDGAYYYGPFRSGLTVNKLLKDINSKFILRKCEDKKIKAYEKNSNCMYFDIKLCKAPCNCSISKQEYVQEVEKVHNYITGINENSVIKTYRDAMKLMSDNMEFESAAFFRDRLLDIEKVMSYQKVITSAINGKKLIIKCHNENKKEIFFVHNGKLAKTIVLDSENIVDEKYIIEEISNTVEDLFFSLHRYVKHKYTQIELDEIKVISNWLALNRERNNFIEINSKHNKEDLLKFIFT